MKHAVIFTNEADFRIWFEQSLASVGVKRIILSQEVCPDYVVEMSDGRIARIEAELFAVNFRYHGHSPSKVDYILACYSNTEEVDGVPVIAVNKLWIWDPDSVDSHAIPDAPLTDPELDILAALETSGGISVAALAGGSFAGDEAIWMRFPPERISALPRGSDDSILTVMPPEAKKFIKKYHHALIGAGLSRSAAESIESLCRRGLVGYRPLALIASVMDGRVIDHPAWIPTELYAKPEARQRYGDEVTQRLFRRKTRKLG
jgi:hypothetical protein